MKALDNVRIELSVVIGAAEAPISQVLKMTRGTMIPLDRRQEDLTLVYAGDVPVASGEVLLKGDKISLRISEILNQTA
jgi:flagellar motor switch protein FliN/FliY